MTYKSDARPETFLHGAARWARHESEMPEGLKLAVWHGEGRTLFYVMAKGEGFWDPVASFTTREGAIAWSIERMKGKL